MVKVSHFYIQRAKHCHEVFLLFCLSEVEWVISVPKRCKLGAWRQVGCVEWFFVNCEAGVLAEQPNGSVFWIESSLFFIFSTFPSWRRFELSLVDEKFYGRHLKCHNLSSLSLWVQIWNTKSSPLQYETYDYVLNFDIRLNLWKHYCRFLKLNEKSDAWYVSIIISFQY